LVDVKELFVREKYVESLKTKRTIDRNSKKHHRTASAISGWWRLD
jgi:hypothetical protein